MDATPEEVPFTPKTDSQWKETLTPEQYNVCRNKGTEKAFTGKYWDSKADGVYLCVACKNELFDSETKFASGTGWPSFFKPVDGEAVDTEDDHSFGMRRTEIVCGQCDSHLGHVFEDGPDPTGLRYCVNSASLELKERKDDEKED